MSEVPMYRHLSLESSTIHQANALLDATRCETASVRMRFVPKRTRLGMRLVLPTAVERFRHIYKTVTEFGIYQTVSDFGIYDSQVRISDLAFR